MSNKVEKIIGLYTDDDYSLSNKSNGERKTSVNVIQIPMMQNIRNAKGTMFRRKTSTKT
jgi:hypothetical protein